MKIAKMALLAAFLAAAVLVGGYFFSRSVGQGGNGQLVALPEKVKNCRECCRPGGCSRGRQN